jgi:tetratricopeptide (TPR) repeat protein
MRRLARSSVAALALVIGCVIPVAARAQPPPSAGDPVARREAKRLFDEGHVAYRRGNYEEAIQRWQASYGLSHEPLIFDSISSAYERLGDYARALEYLQKWRPHAPQGEQREIDARLASLEARLARAREDDAEKREAAEAQRRLDEARRQEEEEKRQKASAVPAPSARPATPVYAIVGWSLVAFGGAAITAGVSMDVAAASMRPPEDEACLDHDGDLLCRDSARADIENSNTLAIAGDVSWIAGAVIAAAGVVVVLTLGSSNEGISRRAAPSTPWQLAPRLDGRGGSVTLATSF